MTKKLKKGNGKIKLVAIILLFIMSFTFIMSGSFLLQAETTFPFTSTVGTLTYMKNGEDTVKLYIKVDGVYHEVFVASDNSDVYVFDAEDEDGVLHTYNAATGEEYFEGLPFDIVDVLCNYDEFPFEPHDGKLKYVLGNDDIYLVNEIDGVDYEIGQFGLDGETYYYYTREDVDYNAETGEEIIEDEDTSVAMLSASMVPLLGSSTPAGTVLNNTAVSLTDASITTEVSDSITANYGDLLDNYNTNNIRVIVPTTEENTLGFSAVNVEFTDDLTNVSYVLFIHKSNDGEFSYTTYTPESNIVVNYSDTDVAQDVKESLCVLMYNTVEDFNTAYRPIDTNDVYSLFTTLYTSSVNDVFLSKLSADATINIYKRNSNGYIQQFVSSDDGSFNELSSTPTVIPAQTVIQFPEGANSSSFLRTDTSLSFDEGIVIIDTGGHQYITTLDKFLKEQYYTVYTIGDNTNYYAYKEGTNTKIHGPYGDVLMQYISPILYDDSTLSYGNLNGDDTLNYFDITVYTDTKYITEDTDVEDKITSVNYDSSNNRLTFSYKLPCKTHNVLSTNPYIDRWLGYIGIQSKDYYKFATIEAFNANPNLYNGYTINTDRNIYINYNDKINASTYASLSAEQQATYVSDLYTMEYINMANDLNSSANTTPFDKPTKQGDYYVGSITINNIELPIGNYVLNIQGSPVYQYTGSSVMFYSDKVMNTEKIATKPYNGDTLHLDTSGAPKEVIYGNTFNISYAIRDLNNNISADVYDIYVNGKLVEKGKNQGNITIIDNGTYTIEAKKGDITLSNNFTYTNFYHEVDKNGKTKDLSGVTSWLDSVSDSLVQTGVQGNYIIYIGIGLLLFGVLLISTSKYRRSFLSLFLLLTIILNLNAITVNAESHNDGIHTNYNANSIIANIHDPGNYYYQSGSTWKNTTYSFLNSGNGSIFEAGSALRGAQDRADFRYFITGNDAGYFDNVTDTKDAISTFTSGYFWWQLYETKMGGSLGGIPFSGSDRNAFIKGFVDWLCYYWQDNNIMDKPSETSMQVANRYKSVSDNFNDVWSGSTFAKLHSNSRAKIYFDATRNDSSPLNTNDLNNIGGHKAWARANQTHVNNGVSVSGSADGRSTDEKVVDKAAVPAVPADPVHHIPGKPAEPEEFHMKNPGGTVTYTATATTSWTFVFSARDKSGTDALPYDSYFGADNRQDTALNSETITITKSATVSKSEGYSATDPSSWGPYNSAKASAQAAAEAEARTKVLALEEEALTDAVNIWWQRKCPPGWNLATYPSRQQILEFVSATDPTSDELGSIGLNQKRQILSKLYACYTTIMGREAFEKLERKYVEAGGAIEGGGDRDIRACVMTANLIALNSTTAEAHLYLPMSQSLLTQWYGCSPNTSSASSGAFNQVACIVANGNSNNPPNNSSNVAVQGTQSVLRQVNTYETSTTTVIGNTTQHLSISRSNAGAFRTALHSGLQGNLTNNTTVFTVNQGGGAKAYAYCYGPALGNPPYPGVDLGPTYALASGEGGTVGNQNNNRDNIHLISKKDRFGNSTGLNVSDTALHRMFYILGRSNGELSGSNSVVNSSVSTNSTEAARSVVLGGCESRKTFMEAYYFAHAVGSLVAANDFGSSSAVSSFNAPLGPTATPLVNAGAGDSITLQVQRLTRTMYALEMKGAGVNGIGAGTYSGSDNPAPFGMTYTKYDTEGANDVDCVQVNGKYYYMYAFRASQGSQPVVFFVEGLVDEDKEVNGNVTQTYDPETQATETGSVVTQYDTDVSLGEINQSRSLFTSHGNTSALEDDNHVPAQTEPNTKDFNLYSVGVATGQVTGNSITYRAIRQHVSNAARQYAGASADGSKGIKVLEPNINKSDINIGKHLTVEADAALYASLTIPTANFSITKKLSDLDKNTLHTILFTIEDSETGLHKAFELNKTANFTSALNYSGLEYAPNDNTYKIVRSEDHTDFDADYPREFNIAGEIYVKEHEVTSYLYNVQVHIEVDDNGTRNSSTIVTKKEVTNPVQMNKKKYNVQDDTTIFQVDGGLTTWSANSAGDTVNQGFLNNVVSICNSGSVTNYETLKSALQGGTGHAEEGAEIAVGFNRSGNDTYAPEDACNHTEKYQGYTVVTVSIDWPSGLEATTVDERHTNESPDTGTEGALWLHQEELNYWFGNMVYASKPDVEWRLKAQSSIISQVINTGILNNKKAMDKIGYGTYVGQVLSKANTPVINAGGSNVQPITYNKIKWVIPASKTNTSVPVWQGSIVIRNDYRAADDYTFDTYNGENYELELSDETYGPEAVEDEKDGYINEYYDVAFNVNDATYKYNLNNNVGLYLGNASSSRFSRHGMTTPYKLTVVRSYPNALGTLITYSFNHVRTFNSDNRNISSISNSAPGNGGPTLAYIKKILRNNTGNVWSGWSALNTPANPVTMTTEFDGTNREETGIFTEIVRMKALQPYTKTTLRYRSYYQMDRDIEINGSVLYYNKNDVKDAFTIKTFRDITEYIKFTPFSKLTRGNDMEHVDGYSSLAIHYVRCHALKYTAKDRNIAYAKAHIINLPKTTVTLVNDGYPKTIGLANASGIIKAGTQGLCHYGCIAQVVDNGANLTDNSHTNRYIEYYPEVVMTATKKDIINDNPSGVNLQHTLTLTMAEKKRKTEQTSLYIMSLQGNQKVEGVTYSESALTGIHLGSEPYTYVTNGSEFSLRINDKSITSNLYGYSWDVIDKDYDSTTFNVPNHTHNASGVVTAANTSLDNVYNYNAVVNDNEDIRTIWGNDTNNSQDSDELKNAFKDWVLEIMDVNNYGVDADLTIGSPQPNPDSVFIDNDGIRHYDGFSGSIGSTTSDYADAEHQYDFPITVINGEIVKDKIYEEMICQIALDYSTVDWTCSYDQAEELWENSGLKWALLDAIESNTDKTDKSTGAKNTSDVPRDGLVGSGLWKYNTDLGNEVNIAYDADNWYDEKVKTVLIRRYKWLGWHFNDIVLEDKIDIAQTDWNTSQWNNTGTRGQWYLNIFFNNKLETLGMNFTPQQIYAPNGIVNAYYGKGTMQQAREAGSVVLYSAYVHDWDNLKSDFMIQGTTSVEDFDW